MPVGGADGDGGQPREARGRRQLADGDDGEASGSQAAKRNTFVVDTFRSLAIPVAAGDGKGRGADDDDDGSRSKGGGDPRCVGLDDVLHAIGDFGRSQKGLMRELRRMFAGFFAFWSCHEIP